MSNLLGCLLLFFTVFISYSQTDSLPTQNSGRQDSIPPELSESPQPVFILNKAVDIPIMVVGTGWSIVCLNQDL